MKRLLAVAALAAVSFTAYAQEPKTVHLMKDDATAADPARLAKVEKLFVVMHIERTMDQMMGMMQQMIAQSTKGMPGMDALTPEQEKLVADYQKKAMKLATDTVGWKAMEPDYARIYATTFTDEQIDAMTTFYSSPAGQALLDKTPEIGQQTMQAVQGKMATLQPQIRKLMEDFAAQMKAASPTTPKPAPKTTPAPSTGK